MPALLSTTIPSMVKIIDGNPNWVWTRSAGNYHVTYKPSGGKIFFKGENLAQDPELTDLLGLECNGILFEQVEELSPKLFQLGCSRLGSWLLEKMPMPITLATCNPSQTWVKEMIYEPYTRNELPEAHIFMPALPRDNGYVTFFHLGCYVQKTMETRATETSQDHWRAYQETEDGTQTAPKGNCTDI